MNKLTQNIHIPCYFTDGAWRLKPASFMNLAQEAATQHATILGFGYDELIESNTAWIISRMHIEFVDTPKWREHMTLQTWHKGLERLFFLRDFIMTDQEGRVRVKATSSWLVLNLDTRRLVRDPNLVDEGKTCAENVIEKPADKVVFPKDAETVKVMEHVVAYSDLDMNGHTNNAMYMHWAMDAVDYDTTSSRPIREFTINFNREARPGERVEIYRVVQDTEDGLHVWVEGKVDGASSFCIKMLF